MTGKNFPINNYSPMITMQKLAKENAMFKLKIKLLIIIMFALLSSGCAKFITHLRVKPQLLYENGLLISNSQTNPYRFKYEDNVLKINYNIIVKNASSSLKEFDLKNAYYQANQEKNDLKCVFTKTNDLKKTLKQDEQTAISCSTSITPNDLNQLKLKDTDIALSIPLERTSYSFTYRVYAEEFVR